MRIALNWRLKIRIRKTRAGERRRERERDRTARAPSISVSASLKFSLPLAESKVNECWKHFRFRLNRINRCWTLALLLLLSFYSFPPSECSFGRGRNQHHSFGADVDGLRAVVGVKAKMKGKLRRKKRFRITRRILTKKKSLTFSFAFKYSFLQNFLLDTFLVKPIFIFLIFFLFPIDFDVPTKHNLTSIDALFLMLHKKIENEFTKDSLKHLFPIMFQLQKPNQMKSNLNRIEYFSLSPQGSTFYCGSHVAYSLGDRNQLFCFRLVRMKFNHLVRLLRLENLHLWNPNW